MIQTTIWTYIYFVFIAIVFFDDYKSLRNISSVCFDNNLIYENEIYYYRDNITVILNLKITKKLLNYGNKIIYSDNWQIYYIFTYSKNSLRIYSEHNLYLPLFKFVVTMFKFFMTVQNSKDRVKNYKMTPWLSLKCVVKLVFFMRLLAAHSIKY